MVRLKRARPSPEAAPSMKTTKRKRVQTNVDSTARVHNQPQKRRGRSNVNNVLKDNNMRDTSDVTDDTVACSCPSLRLTAENKNHAHVTEQKYVQQDGNLDVFDQILHAKRTIHITAIENVKRALAPFNSSIVHYLSERRVGQKCTNKLTQSVRQPVSSLLSDLQLFRLASPFTRRCTAIEWHPTIPHFLAAGCKGGDLTLWNTQDADFEDPFILGVGPGGSIQAMKFSPTDSQKLYAASIDGTVSVRDFQRLENNLILADTMDCHERWYCSLDTNPRRNLLVTGDNTGKVTLMSMDGQEKWTQKLHKSKVSHAEFSPREDWLLCTGSLDHTVKLWDVRMIDGKHSALQVLHHDRGINSAYFSLTGGTRILTTDQHHEVRVYRAPDWHLERVIDHPHRFFQHLTPIKAYWHPLQDLIVVGRYPDEKFPGYIEGERRTIDILDPDSGETVCQLWDSSAKGIVSLNKFNHQGDCLASSMGVNVLLWSRKEEIEAKQATIIASLQKQGFDPSHGKRRHSNKEKKPSSKEKKETKTKEKILTMNVKKSKR